MDVLIAARRKEAQENRAAKARAKANAGKQKVVTNPSSSSESTTSSSSEGEQPPVKARVTTRGKEPTLKAPAKAKPNALSVAKPKGKGTFEEPEEAAMPPPQSPSFGRAKRQASRTSQPSTSFSKLSETGSAPTPSEVRAEQVGSSSDSEASLPTTSKSREISMNELSKL